MKNDAFDRFTGGGGSEDVTADLRCYACDRSIGRKPLLVDTRDGQLVYVGSTCARLIREAGEAGYQPPLGGPRLWLIGKPA